MKTIFELKAKIPYDPDTFETVRKAATDLLTNAKKENATQAIVLYSASGKTYRKIIENACSEDKKAEKELLAELKAAADTEIRYVLCMWQDHNIDIPSFAFRRMLVELDPQNQDALLFVTTKEGIAVIKASSTMK